MEILWNGENIAGKVNVSEVMMYDTAAGMADSADIVFPDPEQIWANWQPVKGDILMINKDDFMTGIMFFDGWKIKGQTYIATAISTPPQGRTEGIRGWNKATFLQIAEDISTACGLQLVSYDIIDYTYNRVDQVLKGNIAFLNSLCLREGYVLKVTNGQAVIFGEKVFEQKDPVKTINRYQMDSDFFFSSNSIDLKAACASKYYDENNILIEFIAIAQGIYGGQLRLDEPLSSIGEAERYAKAALRQLNKNEYKGCFAISLDTSLAASQCINISGIGQADGKWYISEVNHMILAQKTYCRVRKPIEGDY